MRWEVRLLNSAGHVAWGEPHAARSTAVAEAVRLATLNRRGEGLSSHRIYRYVSVTDVTNGREYTRLSMREQRR
jgi:hypothetical protein